MSLALAIALNVIADLALLGLLALVMTRPARLTPHAAEEQAVSTPRPRRERSRARAATGRLGETLPSRS
jgi:hypothetical protein